MHPINSLKPIFLGLVSLAVIACNAAVMPRAEAQVAPVTLLDSTGPLSESGASEDAQAITDAAESYVAGEAGSAAALVAASSQAEAVPMVSTREGAEVAVSGGGEVSVTKSGDVTLTGPGSVQIGVDLDGAAGNPKLVDGVLVQSGVAPATDLVTRATESGFQMVAVLADSAAPKEIAFPMDLPEGGALVPQPDGSVGVMAPVQRLLPAPAEVDRVEREVEAILGSDFDGVSEPSEEQINALKKISPAESRLQTQVEQVAVVHPAWAVDAEGKEVQTSYRVAGDTLIQVVDVDADVVFPVTADPGVDWWKALKCTAAIAWAIGSTVFAVAKLAKIRKYIKALGGLSQTVKLLLGATSKAEKAAAIAKGFATFAAIVFGIDEIYENCRP